jgi:hypothetical protein
VAAEETDRGVVSYSFRSIPMEWRGKREMRRRIKETKGRKRNQKKMDVG